jgi:hypothetical protein
MDAEAEAQEVEMEDDEALLPNENFNLKLLVVTNDLQMKHGLRHNDYQRYRGYCSRYAIYFRIGAETFCFVRTTCLPKSDVSSSCTEYI